MMAGMEGTAGRLRDGLNPDERAARRDGFVAGALDGDTRMRLAAIGGDPVAVDARLSELADEWDIERVLEVNTLATSLIGTGIGILRKRRLLAFGLPTAVAAFVLQHAVRGARPPEALLRRFGFRRRDEIERERLALLALRGGPFDQPPRRPGLAEAIARSSRRRLRR